MKKIIYSSINDLCVAFSFILATKIIEENVLYGCIAYLIAYFCLDYHSYVDKKLGYPNNLFIKNF